MIKHYTLISVIATRGHSNDWSIRVLLGRRAVLNLFPRQYPEQFTKGAGYIGGCTIYLTRNCVDHHNMYSPRKVWQFGVTTNANTVPWTRG